MEYLDKKDFIKIALSLVAIIAIIVVIKYIKVNIIKPENNNENAASAKSRDISVIAAGNVLLSSNLQTSYYSAGLSSVMSDSLHNEILKTDIRIMNQTFSCIANDEGEYHVSSSSLEILGDIGFNLVCLSNSYFRQYGADTALKSTAMLDNFEIKHSGAGRNKMSSAEPASYTFDGKTIGVMSVTIPVSDDTSGFAENSNGHVREKSGIYGTDDIESICSDISSGKESCDFLIVNVCCEDSLDSVSDTMKDASKDFINAGADAIIGCSNSFQGIEYYKNHPIVYGTGNFLNSVSKCSTALVRINIKRDNTCTMRLIPCISDAFYVRKMKKSERQSFYEDVCSKSKNIKITDKGKIKS